MSALELELVDHKHIPPLVVKSQNLMITLQVAQHQKNVIQKYMLVSWVLVVLEHI